MTNDDQPCLFISDRASAVIHVIDAFKLTESELNDVYNSVVYRMTECFDTDDRPSDAQDFLYTLDESNDFANLLGDRPEDQTA